MDPVTLTIEQRLAIARQPFSIQVVGSTATWGGANASCYHDASGRRPKYNPEWVRDVDGSRDYEVNE